MGIDFAFTKPGKRRIYGGAVTEPFETELPAEDFHMGYAQFNMMRYRLFSLFNVRFGLIWWVLVTWCRGRESMLYAEDAKVMHGIEKTIQPALIPLAEQSDTDAAMSSKEVQRLSFDLTSPSFDAFAEIPKYRIAMPPDTNVLTPAMVVQTSANYEQEEEGVIITPDCDVNDKRLKESVAQFARVVCEAARLGFGLQW